MEIGDNRKTDLTRQNATSPLEQRSDPAEGGEREIDSTAPSLAGLQTGGTKAPANLPPSLRGSGYIQMHSQRVGIEAWPRDVVRRLAQFLSPRDTLSFASVSRLIHQMLAPYVRHYTARNQFRDIDTLEQFNAALADDSIDRSLSSPKGALRPQRGDLLAILGERIVALPHGEQRAACDAFVKVASQFDGDKPQGLDELVSAARSGIDSLRTYLAESANLRAAQTAIGNGEHVGSVCERHGIVDAQTRIKLQRYAMACPHIQEALVCGQSARELADAYGIDDSNVREDMRVMELMNAMCQ
jgi:hypothetical protein